MTCHRCRSFSPRQRPTRARPRSRRCSPPSASRRVTLAYFNFGGKFERVVSYQQRDAWRQCLDFAARTSNQYVAMFALNTLENVIRRQWVGIPGNEHAEIRSTLQNFLEVHFKSAPPYIRNKLMKLGCYSVLSLHSHERF